MAAIFYIRGTCSVRDNPLGDCYSFTYNSPTVDYIKILDFNIHFNKKW